MACKTSATFSENWGMFIFASMNIFYIIFGLLNMIGVIDSSGSLSSDFTLDKPGINRKITI
jgi:hypothetical protein